MEYYYYIDVEFINGSKVTLELDSHSFESRPPWEKYTHGETIYDINFQQVTYIKKYKKLKS
jgi:hypothetical protein